MRRLAALVGLVVAVLAVAAGPAAAAPGPANAPEYWFDSWHVPQMWAAGDRGGGITIAEIDTGVNADLPELRGRILPGTDFGDGGNGQVDRDLNAFGHGTAMASIMVARPGLLGITGLAPDAKILPVAVPLRGTSDASKPDRLPDAIRWAADHGAKIISMSLGGLRNPRTDTTPCPDVEQAAVFYALRKGAIVVASVGNTGPTKNTVEEPAACLGVVSVGAIDERGAVAGFSAREPFLTLVAPGVRIPSLGRVAGAAFSGDGTSQAAALVSAALALAWTARPQLTNAQLTARLIATVGERRAVPSSAYGYGMLDAFGLVTANVPADAPNPVWAEVTPFSARASQLSHAAPRRPAPAADHPAGTRAGDYSVGRHPRITPEIRRATAVAAFGLIALVGVLGLGLRRRRARLAAAWTTVGEPAAVRPAGAPPG